MKLADLALDAMEPDEPDGEDISGDDVFGEAAAEAFAAAKADDVEGFKAALKGAVEACVADYMASDEE